MKLLGLIFILGLILTPAADIWAHGGHDHKRREVSSLKIKINAARQVKQLVADKKIEPSWKKADRLSVEKKVFGKNTEWVVTYENSVVKDSAKKKLYIFFNLYGDYIAANFTGK